MKLLMVMTMFWHLCWRHIPVIEHPLKCTTKIPIEEKTKKLYAFYDCYWSHVCFDKRGSSGPTVIMLHGMLIMWVLKRLKQPCMHAVFWKILKSHIFAYYTAGCQAINHHIICTLRMINGFHSNERI